MSLSKKQIWYAVLVGLIIGIIGAIVKFGWEIPFPPRTPDRDIVNPPQMILQQIGFSYDFTHQTYEYSGVARPYISFIIHFAFSIFFGILYSVWVLYKPAIKLWQGAAYGLAIHVLFHVLLLPALGTVPAPWNQPFDEHFSEIFGHMFWTWVMELCRRDLMSRFKSKYEPVSA